MGGLIAVRIRVPPRENAHENWPGVANVRGLPPFPIESLQPSVFAEELCNKSDTVLPAGARLGRRQVPDLIKMNRAPGNHNPGADLLRKGMGKQPYTGGGYWLNIFNC